MLHGKEAASTEGRVVAATLALIEEQGLAAVSISEVAKRAGVARQSVYNHFDDVDAIVLKMLSRPAPAGEYAVGALLETAGSPMEKLELYVRHGIATRGVMADALALRSSLGPEARQRIDEHRRAGVTALAEIITDGQEDGSFALKLDPQLAARFVSGILASVANLPSAEPPAETTAATLDAVFRVLGAGT